MPVGAELQGDGVRFRLWAPAAFSVDVVITSSTEGGGERRVRMSALREGWFEAVTPHARAGSRYAFALDRDTVVPDPASRSQPEGVHGPSEVIDPAAYYWSREQPRRPSWHELVFYELHVGTFTSEGTYRAAIERLDDIVSLGATAIELMPVGQFAGERGWGYDVAYPFAPHAAYGRPNDLKALVEAAQERGLAVFLDVVYNHFGPEGNYLGRYAPQFFTVAERTPWGTAIAFDGPAPVRQFFVENAQYWIEEFRFDGLRLDATHAMFDGSHPHVLEDIADAVRRAGAVTEGGRASAVVENDTNSAALLRSYGAQWDDDVHHALHVLIAGEAEGYYADYGDAPARLLARALAEGFAFQGEASPFRDGQTRGEASAHLAPTSFVTFLQNHDQVGNRALGERISQLAPLDRVRAAAAVVLLAPSLPLVFMGEEWAASTPFLFFCDFPPTLAAAVRRGRRDEFAAFPAFRDAAARERIADPNAPATFEQSVLRWDERDRDPHRAMLAFYREALAARRSYIVPLLAAGRISASFARIDDLPATLWVQWTFGNGTTLMVAANFSADAVSGDAMRAVASAGAAIFSVTPGGTPTGPADALLPWSVVWTLNP